MKKEICKILPDGTPSGLSLNKFIVYRKSNNKWNGYTGQEIYSLKETKMSEFIDGFANIILSLKEGDAECVTKNPNLFESDWTFWNNCEEIILDGKFLTDNLINEISNKIKNIKVRKISDFTDVTTPSLLGCACGKNIKKQFVFDFGNTAIKRGIAILNNNSIKITELDSIIHEEFWSMADTLKTAQYIDDFISNIITETIQESGSNQDNIVSMCISNNIMDNKIANRGGYRSLRFLGDDYNKHLKHRLGLKDLYIYNDAEAVGRIFTNYNKNIVIITLGTYFGIAYPPTINGKKGK